MLKQFWEEILAHRTEMVRTQFCKKTGLKKGTWSPEEDQKLVEYIKKYGIWNWREMPKYAGLKRTGKSCRLRWMNYLRPNIKHGNFTRDEEETILKMHEGLGNKWSTIAAALPGRTDNEIKNYWHTHLKKRQQRPAAQPQECKIEANYQINLPKLDLLSQVNASSQLLSGLCSPPINEDPKINGNLGSETLQELPTLAEPIMSLDNLHAQSLQDMIACMHENIMDPDYMLLYYQFWCQDPLSPYGFFGEGTSDLSWFNL